MSKPVAVDGDTQVQTSSKKLSADSNQTGQWTLLVSQIMKGSKCKGGGKLVEIGATASWMYVGGTSGTPPVPVPPVPDSATLVAGNTLLKDNSQGILVDGDKATGSVDSDNQISVSASQQQLKTS
jgi:hypothetical protein